MIRRVQIQFSDSCPASTGVIVGKYLFYKKKCYSYLHTSTTGFHTGLGLGTTETEVKQNNVAKLDCIQ